METNRKTPELPGLAAYETMRRIDRRVERVRTNPDLTRQQIQDISSLAIATKFALSLGNRKTIDLGKALIEQTDPLIPPEETVEEQA